MTYHITISHLQDVRRSVLIQQSMFLQGCGYELHAFLFPHRLQARTIYILSHVDITTRNDFQAQNRTVPWFLNIGEGENSFVEMVGGK